MTTLERVSMEDLWELLDDVEAGVPTQRVLTAIAYKQGDSTARLAERHHVSQQTIRNWLDRFDGRPLEDAPFDAPRMGRPAKLTDEEHKQLHRALQTSPRKEGIEASKWDPSTVAQYIEEEYEIVYSSRHLHRLLHEAEVSW